MSETTTPDSHFTDHRGDVTDDHTGDDHRGDHTGDREPASYTDDSPRPRGGGWDRFGDDDPERESSSTVALFEGDEGGLDAGQRRALVVLLKQRFISARTHPAEWRALTANPRPIRSRLNDVFMDLVLDLDREVAYKRQVRAEGTGGRPFPTLLYDTPWGREDTVLLVYLRSRFRSEEASGATRVFVDREDMLDNIAAHRPPHATDVSGDAKKAAKAIENLFKAGLLIGPSTGDRFEISRAIEVLLPMQKLQDLLAWLREQNNGAPAPEDDDPFTSTGEHDTANAFDALTTDQPAETEDEPR